MSWENTAIFLIFAVLLFGILDALADKKGKK